MDEALLAQYPDLERTHFWWEVRRTWARDVLVQAGHRARLLDIGCGSGVTMESLAHLCSDVRGVELSSTAVPADAPLRDAILIGRFEDQQLEAGAFDVILMMDVIEHIEDPTSFIEEVARVASDDAIVLVSAPAFSWLWTHHDVINAHFRRYTARSLRQELKRGGLEVVRIGYLFMGLVGPKLIQRELERRRGPMHGEPNLRLRPWVNRIALTWFLFEYRMSRVLRIALPFGTSVVAVARPQRSA